MGISPAELLAVLCLMMPNASSKVQVVCTLDPFRRRFDFPFELALKTLSGANFLSERSDLKLAYAFLNAYSDLHPTLTESDTAENTAYNSLSRDYIRSFLERSLLMQLPDIRASEQHELQDTIERFESSESNLSIGDGTVILPMIASSLSSSDYRLFKAIKERAKRNVQGIDDCLPSTIIRDASWRTSSLLPSSTSSKSSSHPSSLPQLMEIGTSALDALAMVSGCIKDGMVDLEATGPGRAIHALV